MSDKKPEPKNERSEAIQQMEAYLKSIGAKDKTSERMGKSSIVLSKK